MCPTVPLLYCVEACTPGGNYFIGGAANFSFIPSENGNQAVFRQKQKSTFFFQIKARRVRRNICTGARMYRVEALKQKLTQNFRSTF